MRRLALLALFLLPLLAHAESLRSLVKTGNEAYKAGEFDDALSAYRQAQLESPQDALGKFNEGAALYRKEEHDSAAEAFRAAALDAKASGDSRLEAKSLFNLGNALLKGAEASQKYEPQASVDKLKQGAAAYRQALARDPNLSAAAENLQIARARLGELLKQQAQQSSQQSQGSDDLESQIEEQLKKQQELSEDNRDEQQQENPSESEQQQQVQRQKELQQRSQELSEQTPQNQQAQEQLKQAAAEQQKASQQLSQGQLKDAEESQQKAEGHLAQALQQLQQRGDQQSEQQQAQSPPPPSPGQEQGQSQQLQALELTPEDILDQERVARQRRQLLQGQQQRPVEKDW